MPGHDDRSYFQRRARAELRIASTCEDNAAALVHFQMADEYERRVRTIPVAGRVAESRRARQR